MPNMPALIGEGVHCIYTNKSINKKEIKEIDKLFSLSGKTLFFNSETFIDKATAVSGSGPGFIFQLIDIMEKSAINLGFSKNTAKILINETFRGTLNLLNSNNISAEKMVETVATRGCTTEAGINKFIFGYSSMGESGIKPALINPCWSRYYFIFSKLSQNFFNYINKCAIFFQISSGIFLIIPNSFFQINSKTDNLKQLIVATEVIRDDLVHASDKLARNEFGVKKQIFFISPFLIENGTAIEFVRFSSSDGLGNTGSMFKVKYILENGNEIFGYILLSSLLT